MKTKKYLLDTNICISMLKNKYGVRETILKVKPENCYVSEITLGDYISEHHSVTIKRKD